MHNDWIKDVAAQNAWNLNAETTKQNAEVERRRKFNAHYQAFWSDLVKRLKAALNEYNSQPGIAGHTITFDVPNLEFKAERQSRRVWLSIKMDHEREVLEYRCHNHRGSVSIENTYKLIVADNDGLSVVNPPQRGGSIIPNEFLEEVLLKPFLDIL